jgi:Zn finger protein HypA/HybF involved in hydrogenase expression
MSSHSTKSRPTCRSCGRAAKDINGRGQCPKCWSGEPEAERETDWSAYERDMQTGADLQPAGCWCARCREPLADPRLLWCPACYSFSMRVKAMTERLTAARDADPVTGSGIRVVCEPRAV